MLLEFRLHLALMFPVVAVSGAPVCAEEFLLLPGSSFFRGELGVDVPIEGVFIGDFDPQANPFGTETRPTSTTRGNIPIPTFGSLLLSGSWDDLRPTGSIDADWDLPTASMVINTFDIELGVSGLASVPFEQSIDGVSSPFVTVRPEWRFPDGIPELVLLDDADLLQMRFQSEGPNPADLLRITEDIWVIFANVEGMLHFKIQTAGGVVERTALVALPTNGVLYLDQGPRLELGFFSSVGEGAGTVFSPISTLPFFVETSEAEEDAALVFSGTSRPPEFELFVDLGIASVMGPLPDPDLDGNGRVDAIDLGILLLEWGNTGRSVADLDRNGIIGSGDLARLLVAWSSDQDD